MSLKAECSAAHKSIGLEIKILASNMLLSTNDNAFSFHRGGAHAARIPVEHAKAWRTYWILRTSLCSQDRLFVLVVGARLCRSGKTLFQGAPVTTLPQFVLDFNILMSELLLAL